MYARSLKSHRNWIAHRYGLPGPRFDWDNIWHGVISKLTNELLAELTEVIKKEGKKNFVDGNQKSTNQNPDSLDKVSSDDSIKSKDMNVSIHPENSEE